MSINLVVAGPDRVVVCSDNREHFEQGGHDDDGPAKIFQAGERSVFGHVGIGAIATLSPTRDQRDNPRKLLEQFRDEYRGPLFSELAGKTEWLRQIQPGTPVVFSAFCLTRKPSGEVDLLELTFPLGALEDGTPQLGEPEIRARMEGVLPKRRNSFLTPHGLVYCNPSNTMVDPFTRTIVLLAGRINPDLPDADILRDVDHVFQTAIRDDPACRVAIGENIYVAAIDADGFRWLRGKEPSEGWMERLRTSLARR